MAPIHQRRGEYTRVIRTCLFVNSSRPEPVHGWRVTAKHSGQKTIGLPAASSARVIAKSSLAAPCQASSTFASLKVERRMAVPPPQQKLSRVRPNRVATAAFQAEASALANAPAPNFPLGMSQR